MLDVSGSVGNSIRITTYLFYCPSRTQIFEAIKIGIWGKRCALVVHTKPLICSGAIVGMVLTQLKL